MWGIRRTGHQVGGRGAGDTAAPTRVRTPAGLVAAIAAMALLVSCATDDGSTVPAASVDAGAGTAAAAPPPVGPAPDGSPTTPPPSSITAITAITEPPTPTDTSAAAGTTWASSALVCDADRDPTVDPDLTTRVTIWLGLGGDQAFDAFDELVAEFEATYPNIEIEALRIEGYTADLSQLRSTEPDGFPDLYMGPVDTARLLAESGVFVPPAACWGADPPVLDDLLPAVRAAATVDDVLWSYPFNISSPVLLYDRTMFAEVGLDPDAPPTTPEELRDVVETITVAGAATGGLAMYDRSASWLIEQWAVDHGHLLAEPDNGTSGGDVESFAFATDEAVTALEWAREMYVDGLIDWRGVNQSGLDDLLALIDLESGRTAVTLHTSAALGDIAWLVYEAGIDGIDDAELGVGPFPTPSGRAGTLVGGGSLWLLDSDDPVVAGAAARFAEFLMSPSSQGAFAAATGYLPATVSAAESGEALEHWERFPQFSVPYRQVEGQSVSPAAVGMQIGSRVQVQRVLELAAVDVIVGGLDARERLEGAEGEARDILELYTDDLHDHLGTEVGDESTGGSGP